jgi:hypothetical protein
MAYPMPAAPIVHGVAAPAGVIHGVAPPVIRGVAPVRPIAPIRPMPDRLVIEPEDKGAADNDPPPAYGPPAPAGALGGPAFAAPVADDGAPPAFSETLEDLIVFDGSRNMLLNKLKEEYPFLTKALLSITYVKEDKQFHVALSNRAMCDIFSESALPGMGILSYKGEFKRGFPVGNEFHVAFTHEQMEKFYNALFPQEPLSKARP